MMLQQVYLILLGLGLILVLLLMELRVYLLDQG